MTNLAPTYQIAFTVVGVPRPKARAVVTATRAYTPVKTLAYEHMVRMHMLAERNAFERRGGLPWPRDRSYHVDLTTHMDRHRRDLDNILKSILDAGKTIFYDDDAQVISFFARRFYDPNPPRVEIAVRTTW